MVAAATCNAPLIDRRVPSMALPQILSHFDTQQMAACLVHRNGRVQQEKIPIISRRATRYYTAATVREAAA